MAEPLKNYLGTDIPGRIAETISAVYPDFDREAFIAMALDGYEALELTPRAQKIGAALAEYLPEDREHALNVLVESLGAEVGDGGVTGIHTFIYLPHSYFIADHGLEHFEAAMRAQYELTKRFTAEFCIRAYLERHPERTLKRLMEWTRDRNEHVRRLVSEGTRPRLPWAPRLRAFQKDPSPVLVLLEELKDDSAEYVRRSVANNLNDIAKDHPELVVEVAERWWKGASPDRKRLVKHALRSLVKQGHAGALAILGYTADTPASVRSVVCSPERAAIGDKVRIEVEVENPSDDEVHALVDIQVHFVKADGSVRPKVFKGRELVLAPHGVGTFGKTISVAQHTTRKHYPGTHRVEALVNGVVHEGGEFEVTHSS